MEVLHVTDELGDVIQELTELVLTPLHLLLEGFELVLRSQNSLNIVDVVGDSVIDLMFDLLFHRCICSLFFSYISCCLRDVVFLGSNLLLSLPEDSLYGHTHPNVEGVGIKVRRR